MSTLGQVALLVWPYVFMGAVYLLLKGLRGGWHA
jgi:hypothetical protein